LDQATSSLRRAEQRVAATEQQIAAVRETLRAQGVAAYLRGGQTSDVPVGVVGADQLAQEEAYAEAVSGSLSDAESALHALRKQYAVEQATLRSDEKNARDALTRVAADKAAAVAAVAAAQSTLSKVQGDLAVLVRQQQEAERLAVAAQVRAQLAARATKRPYPVDPPPSKPGRPTGSAPPTHPPPSPPGAPTTLPATTTTVPHGGNGGQTGGGGSARYAQLAAVAVAAAQAELGKPYEFGGAGPDSFDCSGLTMWAWAAAGVTLYHLAQWQYDNTVPIPLDALLPGDLVFYGTPTDVHHVGIYIGAGQMVDAPHTGTNVEVDSIYWSDLLGGGRVILP
jgi:cell wall-associated NlpC family hydrolase